MAAAEHGATFPKATAVRASMTLSQLHDFARGPVKPKHDPLKNLKHFAHPRKTK